jgi:peptidyl-prolyl cis-trans isomerase C
MSLLTRTLTAVSAAFLIATATSALAQDATPAPAPAAEAAAAAEPPRDPDAVVAKVGQATVTERDLEIAKEAFASELGQVPEAQWRSVLVDAVINMELLAQAARDEKLGEGPDFEAQLEFLTLQALRNLYVEHAVVNALTEAEIEQGYQTLVVANFKPAPQVRARHILVETEDEAKKIIEQLKGGAAFEELAKQSKDPSGQNGGDLGFFGEGQMVPEFEKAAFALEPGKITETPVQSQFGWHVIKVEEKRMSAPPALAEVEGQLRNYLVRQKFEALLASLRDKYPVEIVDQPAAPAAPAEAAPATPATPEAAPSEPAAPAEQPKP